MTAPTLTERLEDHLKELRLPGIGRCYAELARQAVQETLSYEQFLLTLSEQEAEQRTEHRIERWLRESKLPLEKGLEAFDLGRLPAKAKQQYAALLEGSFLERRENVLAFGNPGEWEDPSAVCAVPGVGAPGTARTVYDLQPAGPGTADRQARSAAGRRAQAVGPV